MILQYMYMCLFVKLESNESHTSNKLQKQTDNIEKVTAMVEHLQTLVYSNHSLTKCAAS